MSLLPLIYSDPFDYVRPSRIFNQRFGLHLDPEDFLTPSVITRGQTKCPFLYYRPWSSLAAQQDAGSTVSVDKDKCEISLDVSHFKPEEITVKATGDNTIVVEGKHEEKEDEHGYISRHFVRKYFIPKSHDIGKVVSNLSSDGVLTIIAPQSEQKESEQRTIPVQETGQPAKAMENKGEKEKEKRDVETTEQKDQVEQKQTENPKQ